FVFMQVEPFLMFALRRRIADDTVHAAEEETETVSAVKTEVKTESATVSADDADNPLAKLSPKKREVAELICLGYTNKDIAKTLVISEHTVKDYVKDIYYTLAVHSRLELAALVNNYRLANKK
ncbi:MAG: LuxR family transcriptional regulator, partial [Clostridia bacterium]|nr:LuxR family transcriptional regulator [Clostridia bacterium]